MVYGVVNNHRGFVQVESEPDAGTTFIVYLPVEHSTEETGGGIAAKVPRKQNAPQTILLVEDEEMLRDLGVTILESEGYRVLAAKDGWKRSPFSKRIGTILAWWSAIWACRGWAAAKLF